MNTLPTEEQAALEDSCRNLLRKEWPLEKALATVGPQGPRHSTELWGTIAEAGWLGFPFSAALGGSEGALLDLGLIYRAAGEAMVPSSLYSSMFAGLLVDALGSAEQKRALLTPFTAGRSVLAAAWAEPAAADELRLLQCTASRIGDEWVLRGTKSFIADLGAADTLLVLVRLRSLSEQLGWGVFVVPKEVVASRSTRQEAFGGTPLWQVSFDDLRLPMSALLGGVAAAATTLAAFETVMEKAAALQCMEMAGGIQHVLDFTIAYVKERKQFGRPLGANQAVQHLLTNIAIPLDGVRVAALKALFLVGKGRAATRAVSIAKVAAGECYVNATITCQQLWGAMGYARETGLYLWTERAKVADAWFGTRAWHLRRLARTLNMVA